MESEVHGPNLKILRNIAKIQNQQNNMQKIPVMMVIRHVGFLQACLNELLFEPVSWLCVASFSF
jgi:hypothetical protein